MSILKRLDEHIEFHDAIDSHKSDAEFLRSVKKHIEELEANLSEYENPKNWTRSFDWSGNLVNEHALYWPRLKTKRISHE